MASRLNIPDDIKLKLWVLSGGRCEFPNCNEAVWRDGTTFKEDNFAHMAHIVAASPNGPRGDEGLSSELQIHFDNLMLVCLRHSRLIDGKNSESYTIGQLLEYKRKHEDRIQTQISIGGVEGPTVVLRFQSPIGDRRVEIAPADIYPAIRSRPLADDKGVLLDFSHKAGRGDEAFWAQFASELSEQVHQSLRRGNNAVTYSHLSVFALAPIPILMHLGNQLGNIIPVDLYQKHRDTDEWKWKDEPDKDDFEFLVRSHDGSDKSKVAFILNLSGKNGPETYGSIIGDAPAYEIEIEDAHPGFLRYRSRVEKFRTVYRQVLSEIGAKYPGSPIYLFPAIPAPIALLCGKELLPKADPRIHVFDKDGGVFVPTLIIN
jgi:hypothetical protein